MVSIRLTKQTKARLSIYYVWISPLIPRDSRQRWMLSPPPIIKEPITIVIYTLVAREEHVVG